jgi:hypothetical protein
MGSPAILPGSTQYTTHGTETLSGSALPESMHELDQLASRKWQEREWVKLFHEVTLE